MDHFIFLWGILVKQKYSETKKEEIRISHTIQRCPKSL